MRRSPHLALAALLVATLAPSVARADDACWRSLDAAIAHRANAVEPAFVRYSVKRSISGRGAVPLVTRQQVVFRSADGAARVTDSLYGDAVRYTYLLEPGPPFVGPSGSTRDGWIENGSAAIATVHAHAGKACDDRGAETIAGVLTHHLHVTPIERGAPGIRDVWVDAESEIRRAVVAQYLDGAALAGVRGGILLDCTIELRDVDHQIVVASVRFNDANLRLDGEYLFGDYAFSAQAPMGTFPP